MQITVNVDEIVIIDATRRAFAEAFKSQQHYDVNSGAGYRAICAQVNEYVRTLDLREYIQDAARAALNSVVNDVLESELRAHVKRTVKAMKQEGDIFKGQEND